jgi:putative sigma-54 modulation protein
MKINFKATNLQLTAEISDYCRDKLNHLDKFIPADESVFMDVELGKTTQHHKHGEIFRAEVNFHTASRHFRAEAVAEDLYAAIDEAKDELSAEVKRYQKKRGALVRRGGRMIKNLLKKIYG